MVAGNKVPGALAVAIRNRSEPARLNIMRPKDKRSDNASEVEKRKSPKVSKDQARSPIV